MAIDYQQLAQGVNFLSNLSNPNFYNQGATKHDILTVNGLQEAKDFKLNRDEKVMLLDANSNILYIKESDSIGKCTVKVFECTDVTDKYEMQNTPANISRDEFNTLSASVSKIMSMLEERNGKHNVQQSDK